jgi:hypothetical protein
MQERAAIADVCPNATAHEHQRNGQSKENIHFKNSTLDHKPRTRESFHLKATAREQSAQSRCDGTGRIRPLAISKQATN